MYYLCWDHTKNWIRKNTLHLKLTHWYFHKKFSTLIKLLPFDVGGAIKVTRTGVFSHFPILNSELIPYTLEKWTAGTQYQISWSFGSDVGFLFQILVVIFKVFLAPFIFQNVVFSKVFLHILDLHQGAGRRGPKSKARVFASGSRQGLGSTTGGFVR